MLSTPQRREVKHPPRYDCDCRSAFNKLCSRASRASAMGIDAVSAGPIWRITACWIRISSSRRPAFPAWRLDDPVEIKAVSLLSQPNSDARPRPAAKPQHAILTSMMRYPIHPLGPMCRTSWLRPSDEAPPRQPTTRVAGSPAPTLSLVQGSGETVDPRTPQGLPSGVQLLRSLAGLCLQLCTCNRAANVLR